MATPVARRTRSQLRDRCGNDEPAQPRAHTQAASGPPTPDNPEPVLMSDAVAEPPAVVPDAQPTAREVAAAEAARARLQGGSVAQPSGPGSSGTLPTGPEPVSMDVEYMLASQLQPLDDPARACQAMLRDLDSSDWTTVVGALTTARQLVAHHPNALLPHLPKFMPLLLMSVKNLRSSVCKTALMCTAEAFSQLRGALLPFTDIGGVQQPASSLLHQVLLKASADKRFIAEEAQRVTLALASSLLPAEALPMLLPYVAHKNPKVRGQAGRALTAVAGSLGPPEAVRLQEQDTQRLLRAAGTLVSDNTPDARNSARELISIVQAAYQAAGHESGKENSALQVPNGALAANGVHLPSKSVPAMWEAFCRATLSSTAALAVLRTSSR